MKQVYLTDDGKVFDGSDEALAHERKMLENWLTTTSYGQFCQGVLDTLDNEGNDEWYGTQRDLGLGFIKAAFTMIMQGEDNIVRSEN